MTLNRSWIARLDTFGMNDPDNNEGHPEDRCTVCERPIGDHRPTYSSPRVPARWPHRRAAAAALAGQWWDRLLARLTWFGRRRSVPSPLPSQSQGGCSVSPPCSAGSHTTRTPSPASMWRDVLIFAAGGISCSGVTALICMCDCHHADRFLPPLK